MRLKHFISVLFLFVLISFVQAQKDLSNQQALKKFAELSRLPKIEYLIKARRNKRNQKEYERLYRKASESCTMSSLLPVIWATNQGYKTVIIWVNSKKVFWSHVFPGIKINGVWHFYDSYVSGQGVLTKHAYTSKNLKNDCGFYNKFLAQHCDEVWGTFFSPDEFLYGRANGVPETKYSIKKGGIWMDKLPSVFNIEKRFPEHFINSKGILKFKYKGLNN